MDHKKVFWITGLSGSGKTTTALALKEKLLEKGISPVLIDGDCIREIMGNRFGYSNEDRFYLAQCYSRLCKNLSEQNQTVICSTISMFDSVREWNRKNIRSYLEVYLKADICNLQLRDPKKLYMMSSLKKEINMDMVGLEKDFEEPKQPDLIFDSCQNLSIDVIVTKILTYI